MKKPSIFKYAPSWTLYAFIWILAQLPYQVIIISGSWLGRLVKLLAKSRHKVIATNLTICYPKLSTINKRKLVNQHFSELGIMLTQTIKAFLGSTKKLEEKSIIKGGEHIEACLENNQGILLVAGHFTALDMGGKIFGKKYPIAGMYRPHKHPLTEYIVTKSRLKYTTNMFKRDELRPIVKHLKTGGVLWYAPDQDYRRGQSVFAPFFNHPASTITATHQLARLSKCKVMYFHVQRNKKTPFYTVIISPPLKNFPSKDPIADTTRINQGIEEMVKRNPAEYLWVHKRFKTTPKGIKNPYKS